MVGPARVPLQAFGDPKDQRDCGGGSSDDRPPAAATWQAGDLRQKPVSLPRYGFDERGSTRDVTKGGADLPDAVVQALVELHVCAFGPNRRAQFVARQLMEPLYGGRLSGT